MSIKIYIYIYNNKEDQNLGPAPSLKEMKGVIFLVCYQLGKSNGKKLSPTSIPTASLSVIYNMLVSSDCVRSPPNLTFFNMMFNHIPLALR